MHLPFLHNLYSHMEWADALIWRTVLAEDATRADDYVLESLVHLHAVQHMYLGICKGESPGLGFVVKDDFAGPEEIRTWARAYYSDAAQFLAELTERRLGQVVPISFTDFIEKKIGGPATPATLGDVVFQVVSHSVHHRAQINRRIREVGGTPEVIDYIGWVWRGHPSADWSG